MPGLAKDASFCILLTLSIHLCNLRFTVYNNVNFVYNTAQFIEGYDGGFFRS